MSHATVTFVAQAETQSRWVALRRRIQGLGDGWRVAWLGLFLVTTVVVIGDDFGVFAPDTKPELYLNPDRLLKRSLSPWQEAPFLGQTNHNTGILPVAALMTLLQAIGLSAWLMQRLTMIAMLMLGAWGAAKLVAEFTGRQGLGPWLGGVVYAWHPWVIVGAATLPVRLPHIVLPWLLLATHRAITTGRWAPAALAGLAYGAMAGINGGIVNLMLLLPVAILVGWEIATGQARSSRAVASVARASLFAVAISLYWVVPSLVASSASAESVLVSTEDPVAIGRLSPPSEILRGMGMWTSYIVIDQLIENAEQIRFLTSGPVVVAGFGLTALGVSALIGTSRRVTGLVAATGVTGVALMVGLNASGGQSPLAWMLRWAFEEAPILTAFRTTNKIGSMLVLALALAIGAGVGTPSWREAFRLSRVTAAIGTTALVAVAAGPIWAGQLHPLQVPVPDYWFDAAAATDTDVNDRLLFLPGNAQTRYLWGHRGVDDLDTALYDERHVAWRSTIPTGSTPATNMLTAFDVGLQLSRLSPDGLTTYTRLLGAGEALVRTDTDWLRNFGRPTSEVLDEVVDNDNVEVIETFGPTAADRGVDASIVDPHDPALTWVALPDTSIVQAWRLADPLLVVGDGAAVDQMARAGLEPASRAMLYVDDLTDEQLAETLAAGGHLVLTDTNHRRRWAISSTSDSYTPLLGPEEAVADALRARSGDPIHQTVAANDGPVVRASDDPYSLIRRRAAGHPVLAYDGNPLTGWQYGTYTDGRGGWLEIQAARAERVDEVQVVVGTEGKAITEVRIESDDRSVVAPVIDGSARATLRDATDRIRITITETYGYTTQPATISEVLIDGMGDAWRPVIPTARLPETMTDRLSPALADSLSASPVTVLVSRLNGDPTDPFDDEEGALRRKLTLPRAITVRAEGVRAVASFATDTAAGTCREVARVVDASGHVHRLLATPVTDLAAGETASLIGCGGSRRIAAGAAVISGGEFVTVDHLAMSTVTLTESSPDQRVSAATTPRTHDGGAVSLPSETETPVLISSGQAWHPGWRASADGVDLGEPIVAGGYAAGWIAPAGTHEITFRFTPAAATRTAQWVSLAAAVLAAVVVLAAWRRRP